MDLLITIVIGVIVLSVIVLVHELGHFIAAKSTGVWVEEFGLGFPPRIFGIKHGDTTYSINWVPFGGFNKLSGEVDPSAPQSLASKNRGIRLLVLSSGIILNLILPFVLFSVAYMIPHDIITQQIVVNQVSPDSPAEMAGIEPGDTILSMNDRPLNNSGDLAYQIQLNLGKEITLAVEHSDLTVEEVNLTPRWQPPEGQGAMGVGLEYIEPTIVSESYPFWQAIGTGSRACIEVLIITRNAVAGMFNGTVPFVAAGPIGIVHVTGEVAQTGISPLFQVFQIAGVISIAVGITQIIPFPALDGGRILFVLIEWVRRGKRVSPRIEGIVHSIGFIILLALLVLITYQDIVRWVTGGSLLE